MPTPGEHPVVKHPCRRRHVAAATNPSVGEAPRRRMGGPLATRPKKLKTKWSELTDADLTAIAGKRGELMKRLAQHYKTDKAKLEKEVDDFIETLETVKA